MTIGTILLNIESVPYWKKKKKKLHKKRVMTDLRQHFFSDTLSEDIVSASSLNNFKGKLQRLHNDGSSTGFYKSA